VTERGCSPVHSGSSGASQRGRDTCGQRPNQRDRIFTLDSGSSVTGLPPRTRSEITPSNQSETALSNGALGKTALFQVNRIKYLPDTMGNAVVITLGIYLDIVNIFLFMLRILSGNRR
jgi:hypothetical protein